MKKYIFLAIATVALSACNKENEYQAENQQAVVRFTAEIASKTTSRATGMQWTAGDMVGVRMADATETTVARYDNMPYTASTAGDLTPTGTDMYYPLDGSNVGFSAYYPYQQGITDTYTVNLANQSQPEAIDLLYAKTTASYNKRSASVPLTFSHQLSRFVIRTKRGAGIASLAGMTVSTKCRTTAAFNLQSGVLDSYDHLATISFKVGKDGEQYEAIILPVAAASAQNSMTVRFIIGTEEYVWKVPATSAFASGYSHEWEVTVTRTGVSGIQGSITPWTTGIGGSGTAL